MVYEPAPAVRVLAEILLSEKVGGIHHRRVGELLVARSEVDERYFYCNSRRRITGAEFDDIFMALSEAEDVYIDAWRRCESGTREWRIEEGLKILENALSGAIDRFREAAKKE